MKISIITIAYNNEKDIRPTLESVINQTYNNIEYIVVDGKSSDKTLDIINEYSSSITKIISEPDKGIYDAINKGIQNATGNVVGLIHAGDRLYDNNVINDIASFFKNNDIDAIYGQSVIVNANDRPIRVNKSPSFKKALFRRGWMPSHQSIYIKRELFDELGHYRLDLGSYSDYEFVLRYFYFNDLKVVLLDRFILKFALGGVSTTNYEEILMAQKEHRNCWKVNGENPPFYMSCLKLIRKIPQFTQSLFYRISNK